jgi:hypothetical protein
MVVDPIWGPQGPPPSPGRRPRLVHSRDDLGETGAPLPFTTFADTRAHLDTADFVEGVLTAGTMSVVYGESNSGKTFFVSDLAMRVAAGMPWRDREVECGAVLYLALEGGFGISNRITAFREEHGIDVADVPFAVVTIGIDLLDPEASAQPVIDTVAAITKRFSVPIRLIVVDTLSRAMAGGNENAAEDMTALVSTGDAIREATQAHVLWIHHSGKDAARGARGHSSLRAATDTEIEITVVDGARSARVTKQRDMDCSGEFPFALKVIELGQNRRGKTVTSCVVAHDEDRIGSAGRRNRPSGQALRALDVLTNALAITGKTGFGGAPTGVASIPQEWWRDAFYASAMPGDNHETKQKAFRRATSSLIEERHVAMSGGRVWLVKHEENSR